MSILLCVLLLITSFFILRIAVKIDMKNYNHIIDEFNALGILVLILVMLIPFVNVVASIVAVIITIVLYYEYEGDIGDLFKKVFFIKNKDKGDK